jgi:arylsulfatase
MMDDSGKPGYRGNLNASCRTIAEVLKPVGYRSYAVGKWHVTRFAGKDGPKDNWPLHRGFDRFYGTIHGAGSYYDPSSLVKDDTMISPYADPDYKPATYYYTDAISDQAVQFVGDHARTDPTKPFFLYVAYTAAHWPMHALPEDVAKYTGKYDLGYEPIRKARFEKGAKLGVIDPNQPISPQAGDWDKVKDKKWEAAGMECYAAMVDRMDRGIGKIVAELKRSGQFENTLILFLQDNGGCAEPQGRTGNKDHPNIERPAAPTFPVMKPEEFAAAGSVPKQTRDGYPVRMGPKVIPGGPDTYVAYGRAWANVSNTPFREYKHWVHEGGIATPLIAHWPKGIAAKGELRKQPGHLIDLARIPTARVDEDRRHDRDPLLVDEGVEGRDERLDISAAVLCDNEWDGRVRDVLVRYVHPHLPLVRDHSRLPPGDPRVNLRVFGVHAELGDHTPWHPVLDGQFRGILVRRANR